LVQEILLHRSEVEVLPARLVSLGLSVWDVPVFQCEQRAIRHLFEGYLNRRIGVGTLELRRTPCLQNSPGIVEFEIDAVDVAVMRRKDPGDLS